jgi:hypothetical protein
MAPAVALRQKGDGRLWRAQEDIALVLDIDPKTLRKYANLAHAWPLQRRHVVPSGVYFVNRTMPAFTLPEPVES